VYHEERPLTVMEGLAPKPVHEFCSILCRQYILNRVFRPECHDVFRDCEQKEIMVSQHNPCGRTKLFDISEDLERIRSSIDQVADEPQSVRGGIKVDAIDELIELRGATLYIADGIRGHRLNGELAESKPCGSMTHGNRASITLLIPPRAANVPVTDARTGRQALTTSCKMRFTEFS